MLGYEYADWLLTYSVEDNFDLDKPQQIILKEEVKAYFRWHRAHMLPAYADFAGFVANSTRNGLRPAEVDMGYARYRELYRLTMEPVIERSLVLLQSLTPGQVDHWLERQHKKNAKMRKEFSGSMEERLRHRYEKIIEELESWTGKLTKDQMARIKVLNATLAWNGNLWLDRREAFQERLGELMKNKASTVELRALLAQYLLDTESFKSEEYLAKSKAFETRLRTLICVIHNMLTQEQRLRLVNQVDKLANDLRALSDRN